MRSHPQVIPARLEEMFRLVPVRVSCELALEEDGLDHFSLVDDAEEDLVNVLPVVQGVVVSVVAGAWR